MRVAIIPARGGSKRVPRKNVIEVGGRPMLTYPIRCALESGLFDAVHVSTEDVEIAEVARQSNASVIDRPAEIAQGKATVVQVCFHALDQMAQQGHRVDVFCCIYPTAIFLAPQDLRTTEAMLDEDPVADVVMGASPYAIHPVKSLKQESGYWTRMWPEYGGMQSQFYPHLLASNGTIYWTRTAAFREQCTFYVTRLKCYEFPRSRVVDIDTAEDLELARRLMEAKRTV